VRSFWRACVKWEESGENRVVLKSPNKISVQARVDTGGSGSFSATGAVGKGTLTVEDVRLIKGEDVVLTVDYNQ